ncbi:hypothetical protein BAE44_0017513 [Dichanthelium oligosanthes]|uniref:Uncharacterized protein n=1 Tax=Dichanthelium oligosanthes TaxID=888268 RepID=A0A1E5V8M0_9POAL|nr:hypothetical protein BAE44_0017513 [Dichanthelium oligosanthes]
MASAASAVHQKAAVAAACFMLMVLLCTGPSAMAYQQPNCSDACGTACRLYGEAACWSVTGTVCPQVQRCRDLIQKPCSITCNQRCNAGPIQC